MVYLKLKTTYRLYCDTNFTIWKMKLDLVLMDNKFDYILTEPKPTDVTPKNDVAYYHTRVSDDFTARHIILVYLDYATNQTTKSLVDTLTADFTKPSMIKLRRYVAHKMVKGRSVN
ncbi:hypothetical protein M0R45_020115 [Rubus argutus]|uniref:Uncharacterized protein n=1 Tax=Rubus argutus TaxID=59490 RepID=A0AAW1X9S1_RUBAR